MLEITYSESIDKIDTPETKESHEPSDNVTNDLKYKDMVNDDNNDVNDIINHKAIDESVSRILDRGNPSPIITVSRILDRIR